MTTGTLSTGKGTSGSDTGSISCATMTGKLRVGGSGTIGSGSDTGSTCSEIRDARDKAGGSTISASGSVCSVRIDDTLSCGGTGRSSGSERGSMNCVWMEETLRVGGGEGNCASCSCIHSCWTLASL